MEKEIRAIANLKFSIPEKNHLKVLAEIVAILYKAKARDFEFIRLNSDREDGYLEYDKDKQPEINPKHIVSIRKAFDDTRSYKCK